MMMQALQAGGLECLVDQERPADIHNPGGYFECQRVKSLKSDSSWLADHQGKAVKIIYRLLPFVPKEVPCRVIFMRRNLDEVVSSQDKMLGAADALPWAQIFQKELNSVLARIRELPNVQLEEFDYARCVEAPDEVFRALSEFLEFELDYQSMVSVVNPKLYRNRSDS